MQKEGGNYPKRIQKKQMGPKGITQGKTIGRKKRPALHPESLLILSRMYSGGVERLQEGGALSLSVEQRGKKCFWKREGEESFKDGRSNFALLLKDSPHRFKGEGDHFTRKGRGGRSGPLSGRGEKRFFGGKGEREMPFCD